MKKYLHELILLFCLICLLGVGPAGAAETHRSAEKTKSSVGDARTSAEKISVTQHKLKAGDLTIKYTAAAGCLQVQDEAGKPRVDVFYVAYDKKSSGDTSKRPVTFVFNGGPGASSVFLHLGALGPKRVPFDDEGTVLPAETRLVANDYTWLNFTDLVFIDPVGTGYSRAAPGVDAKQFYSVEEDVKLAGEFIRLYITRRERWLSPKFIAGESYGATRAAALAGYLQNTVNMNMNGLVLISPALNFQTIRFSTGNDLPCFLYLPSYTAAAWYHKKLSFDLQKDFLTSLKDAENWARNDYVLALEKGSEVSKTDTYKIYDKLAYYTGLSINYLKSTDMRVSPLRFVKELLRSDRRTVGILDSRVTGIDSDAAGEYSEFDPALFMTTGPYAAAINDYLRGELKFETDSPYEVLNLKVNREWNWGSAAQGYVNVSDRLREAMSKNRNLKVFIACGYFDLATPYYAAEYTVNHLGLDPILRNNIILEHYQSGHQLYTRIESLKKLTKDAAGFYKK
jgi:carboxypeptidase C (cathepsin A)